MMVYVSRDGEGNVDGVYGCPQPGYGEEELAADHADVVAFLNPPPDLATYTSTKRWEKEVSGFTWNGWQVHSDDRSQGKYLAEVEAINQGVRQDGEYWKFADGVPRPLTNAQMIELAIAARAHIKACFATEFSVLTLIAQGTITTTIQVDDEFAD